MFGELTQYTVDGTVKSSIPSPSSHSNWPVTSVYWLENTLFYVTYGSPGVPPDAQDFQCFAIQTEKVGGAPTYIATPDAAPAFGDRSRESARYLVDLKDWTPMKHLLVIADAPSTDVGVVSQFSDGRSEEWGTLELEETDRVILPMDEKDHEES